MSKTTEAEIKKEVTVFKKKYTDIAIVDKETFDVVGENLGRIIAMKKKITEYWAEPIAKAHSLHKELNEKKKEMLAPFDHAEKFERKKIQEYLTAQEMKRREDQKKLDDERRKKEEAEKNKIDKKIEKAKASGNKEKVKELKAEKEEVCIAPATVEEEIKQTTRIEGGPTVSKKKDIKITITDEMEVLGLVVKGVLPIGIIKINESKLKQAVKLSGRMDLPGLLIEEIVGASIR